MFTRLADARAKVAEDWKRTKGKGGVERVTSALWTAAKRAGYPVLAPLYRFTMANYFIAVYPLNALLSVLLRNVKYPDSVLHISYMVHIPYYTTRLLRRYGGLKADYLAVGSQSPWWDKYDYHFTPRWPPMPWDELYFFWKVVAKYEIVHCHFGMSFSVTGWDLAILKRMGRKIVVHYRGCEVRDPEKLRARSPELNICQQCDYNGLVCREGKPRVARAEKYGDLFLVTTPDMKDFVPGAIHFPFFAPDLPEVRERTRAVGRPFKIVHVTNHPGIEGTPLIERAIESLKRQGFAIDFVFLRGVPPERVIEEMRDADLSIGKMKMGYYANAQIESMALGVPTITWVRPDLMTDEIARSGFILCGVGELEETLRFYLTHPEELEKKRKLARSSILALHDNERLVGELTRLYRSLTSEVVP